MAETFSNFLTKFTANKGLKQVIVPEANGNSSVSPLGMRTLNATTQIHSIYITKEQSGGLVTDIAENAVYVNLIITDNSTGGIYYLGHNLKIVPYSPFYIEKTITLLPRQSLSIEYTDLNKSSSILHCVCSCVDIV